jgi:undecaprenyl-diphosphatase
MLFDGLFDAVNGFAIATPWLHVPAAVYATWGIWVFAVLMVLGWWSARSTGHLHMASVALTAVGTVLAYGLQQLVVMAVKAPRPYSVHPDALVLIGRTSDPSFPSDHACIAGAVTAGLFFVDRRLGWTSTLFAVLIAAARVYVGAHWPQDVLVGLALGGLVCAVLVKFLRRPTAAFVERLAHTPLRPLLTSAKGESR